MTLSDIVEKTYDLNEGIFANINNDIMNLNTEAYSNDIAMTYAYTRRIAAAGLFLQGVFTFEDYSRAKLIFKILQQKTYIRNNEDKKNVLFQELCAAESIKFLMTYDNRLNREVVITLVTIVETDNATEKLKKIFDYNSLIDKVIYLKNQIHKGNITINNIDDAWNEDQVISSAQDINDYYSEYKALQLIDKIGYEDASIVLYGLVASKFNKSDNSIWFLQMEQFLREEFDAASQGNKYSRNFVHRVCPDSTWYKGAMAENSEYHIDEEGGPQQTLLGIIIPMINEDAELAIKLRCTIVKMIYEDYEFIKSQFMDSPMSSISCVKYMERRERLGYLLEKGVDMSFFKKKTYGGKLIEKLGFEDASIVLYGIVSSRFNSTDDSILISQMEQFVREEFDAASQGNEYSRSFVHRVCPDSSWYKGAMGEDSEYPIDEGGGPQQTLLSIIIPMIINEDGELAVKLRCKIVEMIYDDYKELESNISSLMLDLPISVFSGADFKKRRERLAYLLKSGKANV